MRAFLVAVGVILVLLASLALADSTLNCYSAQFMGVCAISASVQSVSAWAGGGPSDVRGSPTISVAEIQKVLANAGSPAASGPGFASCLYQGGIQYGIDPAFPLAFFGQESTYGKAGIAVHTKGIGNVKGSGPAGSYNGFRAYDSYCEGAMDWYRLIKNSQYYIRAGRTTVEQIVPVYAPAGDASNNPPAYIAYVTNNVNRWRQESRAVVA